MPCRKSGCGLCLKALTCKQLIHLHKSIVVMTVSIYCKDCCRRAAAVKQGNKGSAERRYEAPIDRHGKDKNVIMSQFKRDPVFPVSPVQKACISLAGQTGDIGMNI